MAKFNKFSVLVIILISGFKLGLAAEESTAKRELICIHLILFHKLIPVLL